MTSGPAPSAHDRARPGALGFVLLCGLANVGGVIAYLPLLSLLLPVKVETIAGDARLDVFTACVIAGGITASLSNILFGWLSDRSMARHGGRRRWIAAGLAAVAIGFALVMLAATPVAIVAAVAAFQVAVNLLLAPLAATLAEEVPDTHKGLLGGLLSLGYPVAALFSWAITGAGGDGELGHLLLVFAAVAAAMLPLLLLRPTASSLADRSVTPPDRHPADLWVAWGARLLVQVAGAVLSLYLLYYFESLGVERQGLAPRIGYLLGMAHLIPVPLALIAGRWSDAIDRRKPFLFAAAMLSALGLAGMIFARDWTSGAITFGVYAAGSSIFLSLHASFAMQLLPDPAHRGRDLGFINLANTLPILIGPLLTWALATPRDFSAALAVLAALSLGGGLTVLGVRGRR